MVYSRAMFYCSVMDISLMNVKKVDSRGWTIWNLYVCLKKHINRISLNLKINSDFEFNAAVSIIVAFPFYDQNRCGYIDILSFNYCKLC